MKIFFSGINRIALLVVALSFSLNTVCEAQLRGAGALLGGSINKISKKVSNRNASYDRNGSQGHCAVLFGYSQVSNKYEDENIIAEIYGGTLYISNKTDRPIFIDNKASFMYINDNSFSLYMDPEQKNKIVYYVESIAPKAKDVPIRNFKNPFSNARFNATVGGLTARSVEFMGYIESLRSDLANAPDKTSSALHLEQDESFYTIKAAITYATDNKMENLTQFMVSSWLSDVILAKFYPEAANNSNKNSNAVSVRGRYKKVVHVFADMPFEYEEDRSPISYADIYFNKGQFNTSFFGISDQDAQEAEKQGAEADDAQHTATTFIWEGHSGDFKTSLYDVIVKCQLSDGSSVKEAEKIAEKMSNDLYKDQLIRK